MRCRDQQKEYNAAIVSRRFLAISFDIDAGILIAGIWNYERCKWQRDWYRASNWKQESTISYLYYIEKEEQEDEEEDEEEEEQALCQCGTSDLVYNARIRVQSPLDLMYSVRKFFL